MQHERDRAIAAFGKAQQADLIRIKRSGVPTRNNTLLMLAGRINS
jgi:hypothetical protein